LNKTKILYYEGPYEQKYLERVSMKLNENRKHDILLLITSLIFIIFASGLAVGTEVPVLGTVIPPP
jgi:hypothetical protein